MRVLPLLPVAGLLAACATASPEMSVSAPPHKQAARAAKPSPASRPASRNPRLEPWAGPHGGVPPFDRVKLEHFRPALEQAMAAALAKLDAIGGSKAKPSFKNTLAAYERALRPYGRVRAVFDVWGGALATAEFQALERELSPKLAAFWDKITQNAPLFARIESVYQGRAALSAPSCSCLLV